MNQVIPEPKQIFLEAIEKQSPEEMMRYLDEACQGNPELRARVEQLLRGHHAAGKFLGGSGDGEDTIAPAVSERAGGHIGPYKLLQQIGEGGFGVVFMAEQCEPVSRMVALKVIKPGMDTRQMIARFEAERQALAMMDHPNIAKVFDAGTTRSGRPYFVMELVRGIPITRYCDEHHLTLKQRLELFVLVCQAVQHAHQKGIIHRDLKPTNVLIAQYDDRPVPKVIDFGIAKAAQKLSERTMFTEFGQVVGTLEYMSPEQARLNQLDIDTRSDIYSLGVLLYELLTGSTPFDRKRLQSAAFDEMLRIIREEEPPKPSTRLLTSETLPAIAASRNVEPARLRRALRREFDWIVMKALEKDRNRRYETAGSFAKDIEHSLHDEPVQACPPSASYRLQKFARRNKLVLIAGGLIGLSLIVGTVVSVWQAARAMHAEQLAQTKQKQAEENLQKARDAVNEYFTLVSQNKLLNTPGLKSLRRDLMEAALRYYEGMLDRHDDNPAVLADIAATHMQVSTIYHCLNRNDDSLSAINKALPIVERLMREYPGSHECQRQLAGVFKLGASPLKTTMPKEPAAARRTLLRALEVWTVLAESTPSVEGFQNDFAFTHLLLGQLEGGLGFEGETARYAQAVDHLQKAEAILDRLAAVDPHDRDYLQFRIDIQRELEWHLAKAGDQLAAQRAHARHQELIDALAARFPDDLATSPGRHASEILKEGLGLVYKDPKKAEDACRQALQEFETLVIAFPNVSEYQVDLANCYHGLDELLSQNDRLEEGIKYARKVIRIYEQLLEDFPELRQRLLLRQGHNYRFLAYRLSRIQDYAAARAAFQASSEAFRQCAENTSTGERATCIYGRAANSLETASLWEAEGRHDEAQQTFRQALERYELLLTGSLEKHITAGWINGYHSQLAQVLERVGTPEDALRIFDELHPPGPELDSAGLRGLSSCYVQIARIFRIAGRNAEGEDALRRAQEVLQEITHRAAGGGASTAADSLQAVQARLELILLLEETGLRQDALHSLDDAARWLESLVNDVHVDDALREEIGHTFWKIAEQYSHFEDNSRAQSLLQLGLDVFAQLEKSQPKQPNFRLEQGVGHRLLASVMERTGQKEELEQHLQAAIGFYEKLVADLPESEFHRQQTALVHAWLGRIYSESGRWDVAATSFTRSLQLVTTNHEFWTGRAWAYFHAQKWEEAIADYSKAIELAPEAHTNWFHRGHAHVQLSQWDKAATDFTKVVEAWPEEPDGWYLRALAFAQSSQPEKALTDLRQAVAKGFKNIEQLKNDPLLEPLRSSDGFKKLLTELENEKSSDP